jgi:zinc protease
MAASVALLLSATAFGQSSARSSATPAPALPTVDKVLDRSVEAAGGREAWQKLTSRVSTGTIEAPAMNLSGTIEVREKAPNRVVAVVTIAGAAFRQGFDGSVGWTDDPQNGLHEQSGAELAEARRDADFYHGLDLRLLYAKLSLAGTEKIGERTAYVIVADLPEGGAPDRFYFDTQTGLRLRVVSQHHDAEGPIEYRVDYDDYRDVDGVKLPFSMRQTSGDSTLIIKIGEVHHNVPIDDSQFSKSAVQ